MTCGPASRDAAAPSSDGGRRAVFARILTARLALTPVAPADECELWELHSDPVAFEADTTAPLTERAQMRWLLAQWRARADGDGAGYWAVRPRGGHASDAAAAGPAPIRTPAASTGTPLLGVIGLSPLPPLPDTTRTMSSPARTRARDAHGCTPEAPARMPGPPGGTATADDDARPSGPLSLYYRFRPDAQGRGYASEAIRALLAHPEHGPVGRELLVITHGGNARSLALAGRLGFTPAPPARPVPSDRPSDVLLTRPSTRPGDALLPRPSGLTPEVPR